MEPPTQSNTGEKRRSRQLKLFRLPDPLTLRFGPAFFQSVPSSPGVYFLYDGLDGLLYIGQSANLRDRLGSYRHVNEMQHPRRTLRLVSRVRRIVWQECQTAREAIEEESRLLLAHRPPFNRAGVWRGEPWWLTLTVDGQGIDLLLAQAESREAQGPLPPSFRYVLPTLIRCALRLEQPDRSLAQYPCGLMRHVVPREFRVPALHPALLKQRIIDVLKGEPTDWIEHLSQLPAATESEAAFWREEAEILHRLLHHHSPGRMGGGSSLRALGRGDCGSQAIRY